MTHRHRFLPERPSQVVEGAIVERCSDRDCDTIRIRPPDAVMSPGRPAMVSATRELRPGLIGAAGEPYGWVSGATSPGSPAPAEETPGSSTQPVNGPSTTSTRSTSAQEAPA